MGEPHRGAGTQEAVRQAAPLILGQYNSVAIDQAGSHHRSVILPFRQPTDPTAYLHRFLPSQSQCDLSTLHSAASSFPDRPPADRMSTIDEVKSRIDIVQLIEESGVKLRK